LARALCLCGNVFQDYKPALARRDGGELVGVVCRIYLISR
jgi:hypothetical protein